jgi:hypothetical protein
VLESSYQALHDAERARNELEAVAANSNEFRYRFRAAIALLMTVGTAIDAEVGGAAPKAWWRSLVAPHASQLMKLRDPILKHNQPPASQKFHHTGQLLQEVDAKGDVIRVFAIPLENVATGWTWDSGPYKDQKVLEVIDLYLALLRERVFPEAAKHLGAVK